MDELACSEEGRASEGEGQCMAERMWADFSARYSNARRDELDRFPKLKAAWENWQVAWTAGADAALSQADEGVYHNEEAGPPDCGDRGD